VKVTVTGHLSLLEDTYINHKRFAAYIAVLFITFFHILLVLFCTIVCVYIYIYIYIYIVVCFVYFCLFCTSIFYVVLLLCMFHSGYSILLCYSMYCLCIHVYCTTATGCQPDYSKHIYHTSFHCFTVHFYS
jgi:hypothetical protein